MESPLTNSKIRYDNIVGLGPQNSKLLIVGESPGAEEELMGEPFVGRQGVLLRKILVGSGLSIEECFLTLAIKQETATHTQNKQWLWEEIKAVNPQVVVTLGKIPTRFLLKLKKTFLMADYVGKFHTVDYMPCLVAPYYSPNHVMQNGKKSDVAAVEFFKTVKERLV